MAFTDNFGNPKGLLGRMMLVSMDREHLPMAEWGLEQLLIPPAADIIDLGCGGGYNIKRMLQRCDSGSVVGFDISEESVRAIAMPAIKRSTGRYRLAISRPFLKFFGLLNCIVRMTPLRSGSSHIF